MLSMEAATALIALWFLSLHLCNEWLFHPNQKGRNYAIHRLADEADVNFDKLRGQVQTAALSRLEGFVTNSRVLYTFAQR